jgi:hypothetical protein
MGELRSEIVFTSEPPGALYSPGYTPNGAGTESGYSYCNDRNRCRLFPFLIFASASSTSFRSASGARLNAFVGYPRGAGPHLAVGEDNSGGNADRVAVFDGFSHRSLKRRTDRPVLLLVPVAREECD